MKTLYQLLMILVISTTLSALEPSKVAYYTNNTAAQNVYVELKNYSNNTLLFRGETFSLSPNDNGIVIVDVNDYPAGGATGDWSGINASVINTSTMLDIYVNGTLFSQKRYDQLILVQAEATVLDNSGNFNPLTLNGTIGTDDNRWDDVYVGGNTLHIGPDDGDLNNTEMELSYSGNTGTVTVDNVAMLNITTTGINSNGNILLSNASSSISNSASTQVEFADNIYLQPNNDLVFEGQSAILTNSTAPIRIEDDLAVGVSGGANDKFYVSLSNGNTRIDGDLTLTGTAGAGTRLVTANTTGVLSASTALPAGTIIGTTDAQTLTNKTIDADNNTITNIENADIKANAGIDATKLADGSVTSTELQYINSVTSNVQTQLNGKQANLPSQSGNSGRYLTTDGTNLSWGTVSGGGGGGPTISSDVTVQVSPLPTTNYADTGVEFTLDANSVYEIIGSFQDDDLGGTSGRFDVILEYTGSYQFYYFESFGNTRVAGNTTIERIGTSADDSGTSPTYINGKIITNAGGTIKLRARESATSGNTVEIDAGGEVYLIKY